LTTLLNNKLFVVFLAPFTLGIITILGFSPYNLTFVNFFTFSLLLLLISLIKKKTQSKYVKKKSNRYFFYLGCAFGFGFFLFGNYWITISLTHEETFKSLIPFALILIPLFLSLFFGMSFFIVGKFYESKISFILLFSLIFSIFEFLRGNLLTGFPWNLISYTWSWSIESIQILSIIGTYSLSLLSVTFFCIPVLFIKKKILKKNIIFLLFFLIFFIINYLYGSYKISNTNYNFDNDISVKVISPNFSLLDYNTNNEIDQLKRLIKISDPQKDKKTLFIWPEGIFYESYLQNIGLYKDLFKNKFSENHLIILGINNYIKSNDLNKNKYFNSLVILNHKLEVISVYNKIKLVPFGEFLPFEKYLSRIGLKKITHGYNSFSPGNTRKIINLGNHFNEKLLLPLICYEIIYSGFINFNKENFDLIINISEDGWFGNSIGPDQHFSHSIFRAIEEGKNIIRSANNGISAYISSNGEVINRLESTQRGAIKINNLHISKNTFFSKVGNKMFFYFIIFYITLIFFINKNES